MSSPRAITPTFTASRHLSAEERAFMTRLAALNAAFEAARAGVVARPLADEAARVDAVLERFFHALTSPAGGAAPPR